jgi:hypothetical protein
MICQTGSPSRVVVVSALLTCGTFFAFAPRTSAAEVTLDTLRSQLRETLSGLQTIEMHYRRTQLFKESPTANEHRHVSNCEWVRDGSRVRFVRHADDLPGIWSSFDGKSGYQVTWDTSRQDFPTQITKLPSIPESLEYDYLPDQWIGLKLPDCDRTLQHLLDGPDSKLIGRVDKGELVVYEVDLGVHRKIRGDPWNWRVWLCPDRDGLPVELQAAPADNHPEYERVMRLMGVQQFQIAEFRRVTDESLERERWLPTRFSLKLALSSFDHEATLVRVNRQLPDGLFIPAPQAGTRMVDVSASGRKTTWIHEPEKAIANLVEQVAQDVKSQSANASSERNVVARPADWSPLYRALRWIGAFLLLGVGVVYAVASLRSRG